MNSQQIVSTGNVFYWGMDSDTKNFGDFISHFLTEELFYPFNEKARGVHIVGSVLDDMFIPATDADTKPVVFWGCGLRNSNGVSRDRRPNANILSVRGPLSASELNIGHLVPIGDPGLLLPALYDPAEITSLKNKSVCIPHFYDDRTDKRISELTGCDHVIRPNIQGTTKAFTNVIDAICSANFVLCSSLHAAIIAAAYGKRFAFWDSGNIDIPFKWEDFAASINIPPKFSTNLEEAKAIYFEYIENKISLPPIWPMILNAPLPLRTSGLLKIVAYEASLQPEENRLNYLKAIVKEFEDYRANHEQPLIELFSARRRLNTELSELWQTHRASQLNLTHNELELNLSKSEITNLSESLIAVKQELLDSTTELTRISAEHIETERLHRTELNEIKQLNFDLSNKYEDAENQIIQHSHDFHEQMLIHQKEIAALTENKDDLQEKIAIYADLSEIRLNKMQDFESRLSATENERSEQSQTIISLSKEIVQAEDKFKSAIAAEIQNTSNEVSRLNDLIARERFMTSAIQEYMQQKSKTFINKHRRSRVFSFGRKHKTQLLIEKSELFDPAFYKTHYRDVFESGKDPLDHYIEHGLCEKRSPNSLFDPIWYETHYSDLMKNGENPFIFYLTTGISLNHSTHPLFDAGWYIRNNNDLGSYRKGVLHHYIHYGAKEGRNPNPFFDTKWYTEIYPDVNSSGITPLAHYCEYGEKAGRRPSPLFEIEWYEHQVANRGVGLRHYFEQGRYKGVSPHPYFDAEWYALSRPDVTANGQPPFEHYLQHGEKEGTCPNPFFDPKWYLDQNPDVLEQRISPLFHFAAFGANEGRDPSPAFSIASYLEANPDVKRYPRGALFHYLVHGRSEGRNIASHVTNNRSYDEIPLVVGEKRIVIVDSTYPTPDRDSGSVDAVNFIRIFQRLGYSVYFISTVDFISSNMSVIAREARRILEANGVYLLDDRYGMSPNEIIRMKGGYFDIFFLSRVYCGGEAFETIRSHAPKARIIFNTVDLHSLRELREAQLRNDRKAIFHSYRVAEREYYLSRLSDATIVVSEEEARLLTKYAPGGNIVTIPLIRDIPGKSKPFEQRTGIGFIGGYRHSPNIDAVHYFLDEIWPLIRAQVPTIEFFLMGADMPHELSSRRDAGLKIVGQVDDLTEVFSHLRLTVAPLRYGAGAKGKVVTSLSHGVPCVASPVAAEGMGVGEASAVLIGHEPEEFAAHVIQAYLQPTTWNALSDRGLKLMHEQYSFVAGSRNVELLLSTITQ